MTTRPVPVVAVNQDTSDEELIALLVSGQQEALGPLYSRYAPLVFNLAARSLDRPAAEEIVQEVFLTVWRKGATFDPERGTLRSWLLQIAHFRIINELRARSRRPQVEPDPDGRALDGLIDSASDVEEQAWLAYEREALRAALDALPQPQRQAVSLAFLQDFTHEQVASALNLPLGTAKTRIRAGVQKLRLSLAPLGAAVLLAGALGYLGFRYHSTLGDLHRDEGALALVTDSDTQAIRVTAAPGVSQSTHAVYRGRPGSSVAVITMEHFPAPPPGQTYQVWVREHGVWVSLGTFTPDRDGAARMIVQDPILTTLPDAIEITLAPNGGSPTPTGATIAAWPGP